MDTFGEYQQILSLASPPPDALGDPVSGRELSKIGSDGMAELCRKYPDRFPSFIASIAMTDAEGAAEEARRAIKEGDLRGGIDPDVLSASIMGTIFGARLVANAISSHGRIGDIIGDPTARLHQIWNLLLPGVVSEASLPYFQQFLRREEMRHAVARASQDVTVAKSKT